MKKIQVIGLVIVVAMLLAGIGTTVGAAPIGADRDVKVVHGDYEVQPGDDILLVDAGVTINFTAASLIHGAQFVVKDRDCGAHLDMIKITTGGSQKIDGYSYRKIATKCGAMPLVVGGIDLYRTSIE